MNKSSKDATSAKEEGLGASVQLLPLPPGLYLFSVTTAASSRAGAAGLRLPAVHVVPAPGVDPALVEFVNGPDSLGAWLFAKSDLLVVRVTRVPTTLLLTSVRAPGGEVLSIRIERLDARKEPGGSDATPAAPAAPVAAVAEGHADDAVPMQVAAHIRARGDMTFTDAPWAGRVARGLWIESFSLLPLARLAAQDVEYKGLTGSGFETPWTSDQKMCGSRGMSVPLVGFAVRVKPGPQTAAYDCEYSGYFQSGVTIGPLRSGAPCRSTVANDPLEGIQVRLVRRSADAAETAAASRPAAAQPAAARGARPARR